MEEDLNLQIKSEVKFEEEDKITSSNEQDTHHKVKIKDEQISDGDEGENVDDIIESMDIEEDFITKEEVKVLKNEHVQNSEDEKEEDDDDKEDEENEEDEDDGDFEDDILNYCKVCKSSYSNDEEYRDHYKKISTGGTTKSYGCCNCLKNFRDLTQLKVHQRKHTGEKPYACNICNKRFSINGNLTKHKITHTGERRFQCDTCDKKFTQFAHLEDHMRIHSGERPFKCDLCDTSCRTQNLLRKHLKAHNHLEEPKNRRYRKCEVCNKRFNNFQYEAHMAKHDIVPIMWKCSHCQEPLSSFRMLERHVLTKHIDFDTHTCNVCNRSFINRKLAVAHVKTHFEIKPYICQICQKAIPNSQNIKRHLRAHAGENRFKCKICERAFLTKQNLKRHLRIHTKEKPYSCPHCDKKFSHSSTAKEHQIWHTGEKPFGCVVCNKFFSLLKTLNQHIRNRHPEELKHQDIKKLGINLNMSVTNTNIKVEAVDVKDEGTITTTNTRFRPIKVENNITFQEAKIERI